LTGAYTFVIGPGAQTVMDIDARLYPRRDLSKVGMAPLTSMFLKDSHDSDGRLDFRPAIHDSDGLASWNGRDERLWRPLVSPRELQISSFEDSNPKGFGLIQRARTFDAYQDLEAHYEARPSAWIEPTGNWGEGCTQLVEIPTEVEYFDNIVSYWRPTSVLPARQEYAFGYRLSWCDDAPAWKGHRVGMTRIGEGARPGTVRFVVDFLHSRDATLEQVASISVTDVPLRPLPEAVVSGSAGLIGAPLVQRNPESGGIRATFELDPHGAKESELRLALVANGAPASEVWLFRWHQ
jgi:glucans biosynthesis protein